MRVRRTRGSRECSCIAGAIVIPLATATTIAVAQTDSTWRIMRLTLDRSMHRVVRAAG
jgi:hypothetical protein